MWQATEANILKNPLIYFILTQCPLSSPPPPSLLSSHRSSAHRKGRPAASVLGPLPPSCPPPILLSYLSPLLPSASLRRQPSTNAWWCREGADPEGRRRACLSRLWRHGQDGHRVQASRSSWRPALLARERRHSEDLAWLLGVGLRVNLDAGEEEPRVAKDEGVGHVHGDVASGCGGGGGRLERQAMVLAGEAIGDVHVAVVAELGEQRVEAGQVELPSGGALGADHHAVAAAQEPRHGATTSSSKNHRDSTARSARNVPTRSPRLER
ncbi:hypothetical protein GQ55_5G177900 [Panicum hallii var. hallii]|uniref:Uncharacterized protein n=1 Tax=Panicum hallii var. hallii TaxID=1504633 RepID=A0A2T7DHF0_9POAL|nr:hypothetical protein GQ55_5G177900 [Panicum hallii var. hallii]